ncbi:GPI ethanolamine phosphate transferase 2 [Pyrenophora tritici-repentis]|uniref:GPI ethanolamine phosphate transferase 2 n=1 Tax=Pyrenophora tritici-repentis TaxID=45151 RepID=A0A922NRN9_9PLEO|nr:gpi ethanolamine phosphate transferase [Pyrenophora tritici-repentis]KAI1572183.1 GPI ethanolamine phosphate transferase 2 [Pyrenophora tritici-repentis]KAI1674670.1 gpi ethanolamine phosphate transferase [Pyrenophora tritici-repentis]KAI1688203.1 gpi ethanolamine phosphate transferase [Pyrenophora tritici-repentis]
MALRTLLITVANLLIPVAILVFATGFFPYKPYMPGLAQYEELGWSEKLGVSWQKPPEAPFDKLVFMVVDALRSDFVYGEESGMSFVQSLIRDGTALPFTAHATSPTITMPRVKAITTGSIPSFVDVILNFAESDTTSTLATQDTWLAQIKAKDYDNGKGKLVMYGDDTWLKLFPNVFERADGTTSFFVSDFTEVDNNVTRHVPNEMLNSDWNAMIMHYLGLDHIGHKAGPKSPNMIPKQIEMDGIVRDIYSAMENEDHLSNTLLVLCGDHGMNDGGNHGGSSPGETSPALVFMSPKLTKITNSSQRKSPVKPKNEGEFEYYRMVEQSDIAPTLAGLLGFPVPQNNLGVFLDEFLAFWDKASDRAQILYRNAKQMKKIVEAKYTNLRFDESVVSTKDMGFECSESSGLRLTDGQTLACLWQGVVTAMGDEGDVHSHLYKFMHLAQETMSSTASNYDLTRLFTGTGLAFLICALSFFTLPSFRPVTPAGVYYSLALALYSVLMFASSYVEEEHNFWYWATSGWLLCLFFCNMRKEWYNNWIFHPAIMVLATHRVIRRWNQTGQKYAGADDIVNSGVFHGSYSVILWILIGATYMDITIRLARHVARSIATFDTESKPRNVELESTDQNRMFGTIAVLPLCGTAFIFKLAFTLKDAPELTSGVSTALMSRVDGLDLVGLVRMIFGGLLLSGSWIVVAEWTRSVRRTKRGAQGNGELAVAFFDLTTLFILTQTKAQNIPLYFLFRLQYFFLTLLDLTPTAVTLTTLLLTQTSFFALGNSNAISSIDLSNSYNGISGYNVVAVGTLVFVSNWAGPMYWSLAGILLLGDHGRTQRFVDTRELHVADWVAKEREWLNEMARKEEKGREIRKTRKEWEDIEGGKPPQPAPETPPHVSTFPNQFPHDADHDRTKSPMTSLPNYSEPDSPTQKRGKGIVRNIMSDTWTEGAYIKPNSTTEQIIDVEKMQDR